MYLSQFLATCVTEFDKTLLSAMPFEEQLEDFYQFSYLWLLMKCLKRIQLFSQPLKSNIHFTVDLLALRTVLWTKFSTFYSERIEKEIYKNI
jgi:hypothetical protein